MELIKSSSRRNVDNLFNSSTEIYKIPDYQRDYKWTTDEAEQFLEDFSNADFFEPQYLGVIVTNSSQTKYRTFDEIEVIDGQQRLTTLFLIFLAIRKFAKDNNNDSLVITLDQKLISHEELHQIYKIKTHKYLQDFFDAAFNYKSGSALKGKTVKKVYEAIYNYISTYIKPDRLKDFYLAVIKSEFVYIEIGNASPFEIFERMNYRGMDLAVSDLLKNKLFLQAHKTDDLENMKEHWDKIIDDAGRVTDNINKLSFSALIRYFYISRFGYITEKKLYGKLVDQYNTHYKDNLNIFIEDFESVIKLLLILSKKRNELSSEEIKSLPGRNSERGYLRTILSLKTFGVIQPYSLLLSLFAKERNLDLRNWLNRIEVFHFVYSYISNGPAREFEKKYSETAKNVFNAESDNDVQAELNNFVNDLGILINKTTTKEKFISDVSSKLVYGSDSDAIKFFYEYIEEEYFGRNLQGITFINNPQISLDHICPQNEKEDHSLGNLIVLETDINQQLQDASYKIKKEKILSGSGISITKELFNKYDNWGEDQINDWGKYIASIFWDEIVIKYFNLR